MAIKIGVTQINAKKLGGLALNKIMLGLTEVFPNVMLNPRRLFLNGEQGAWYDFYDDMDTKIAFRRNLLLWSEDFGNTVSWTVNRSSLSVQPSGFTRLVEDTTPSSSRGVFARTALPATRGTVATHSVLVKKNATRHFCLWVGSMPANPIDGYRRAFDLTTGEPTDVLVNGTGVVELESLVVEHDPTTWRISTTMQIVDGTAFGVLSCMLNSPSTAGIFYTGDGVSYIEIDGAQLEYGSTASPYQKVTDWNTEFLARFPSHALFQTFTGDIPVTNVEQPIGLVLDKRLGLVLGPDLAVNGSFTTNTDWVLNPGWAIAGGKATKTPGTPNTFFQSVTLSPNKSYLLTCEVSGATAGTCALALLSPTVAAPLAGANGTRRAILTNASSVVFGISSDGTFDGSIDNITIKEIPGNHAIQATAANRLQLSARKNLLTWTEDFSNAVWPRQSGGVASVPIVTANYALSPTGTTTASRVQLRLNGGVTAGDFSRLASINNLPSGVSVPLSVYLKADVGSVGKVVLVRGVDASVYVLVTLTEDWQRVETVRTSIAGGIASSIVEVRGAAGSSDSADVLVWGAQLEYGPEATRYQRVNTATDYDTMGFPFFARYNGVNNTMATASPVDFTATDKMGVFVGLTKFTVDSAQQRVLTINTGNGNEPPGSPSVSLMAGDNGFVRNGYGFRARGVIAPSNQQTAASGAINSPHTAVLVATADLAGDLNTLTVNDVLFQATMDLGTGNFGSFPMRVGSDVSSLFLDGQINQFVALGRAPTAQEIIDTKLFIAEKLGELP